MYLYFYMDLFSNRTTQHYTTTSWRSLSESVWSLVYQRLTWSLQDIPCHHCCASHNCPDSTYQQYMQMLSCKPCPQKGLKSLARNRRKQNDFTLNTIQHVSVTPKESKRMQNFKCWQTASQQHSKLSNVLQLEKKNTCIYFVFPFKE